jgi:two-component system chemotaxis response regulator CheB
MLTKTSTSSVILVVHKTVRVLIVDDSAVVRRLLEELLRDVPGVEVVGTAPNGEIALQRIDRLKPDVVTLDIEMPVMDGMQTLRALRDRGSAIRVVMFSTLTARGGHATLEALSLGADDYVTKPSRMSAADETLGELRQELTAKILQFFIKRPTAANGQPARAARMTIQRAAAKVDIVAIGVSTGGPTALTHILSTLPADFPCPIVVTQHMPPMFTRLLAERLASKSRLRVEEAGEGSRLEPGLALIAPGGHHLKFRSEKGSVVVALDDGPPENSCRPAVDVMFRSVASIYGRNTLAVILTGMGRDGFEGTKQLKAVGASVLAQDRATSVVWGMPGYVVEAGLADIVAGIDDIGPTITSLARRTGR